MSRQVVTKSQARRLEHVILSSVGITCARRYIANEYKEVQPIVNHSGDNTNRSGNSRHRSESKQQTGQSSYSGAPPPAQPPPTTFNEQFLPMDFNPHI